MQGRMEDIDVIQRGFGNYGHGLGSVIQAHGGLTGNIQSAGNRQEGLERRQEGGQSRSVPPNSLSTKNGIWDVTALRQISGWQEEFQGETLKKTMDLLDAFHNDMDTVISLTNTKDGIAQGRASYERLLKQVSQTPFPLLSTLT